jgi:hypothetical protein
MPLQAPSALPLELGGGLALTLERRVGGQKEASRDERVGLAELARVRLDAQACPAAASPWAEKTWY